jgi:hypothetical protein
MVFSSKLQKSGFYYLEKKKKEEEAEPGVERKGGEGQY